MEAGMMWQNVISQIERHSATYWWMLKREYSQVLKRFFHISCTITRKKSVRKVSGSDQIASGVLMKYFSKQMAVCRFSCTQCKSFTAPSLRWESLLETSASMQKHENKSPEKVGKNNWETIPLKNSPHYKSSFWWVWHIAKLDFKFKLKRYLKVHWAIFCVIWNLRGHMRNKFASIIDSITSELISIWRPLAISLLKTTYLEFCDIHDGCKNLKWWLFFKRPFPLLQYLTLFAPRLGPGGQICSHPVQTYVPKKINGWQFW